MRGRNGDAIVITTVWGGLHSASTRRTAARPPHVGQRGARAEGGDGAKSPMGAVMAPSRFVETQSQLGLARALLVRQRALPSERIEVVELIGEQRVRGRRREHVRRRLLAHGRHLCGRERRRAHGSRVGRSGDGTEPRDAGRVQDLTPSATGRDPPGSRAPTSDRPLPGRTRPRTRPRRGRLRHARHTPSSSHQQPYSSTSPPSSANPPPMHRHRRAERVVRSCATPPREGRPFCGHCPGFSGSDRA